MRDGLIVCKPCHDSFLDNMYLSISLFLSSYTYVYNCTYIYIYIYTYIYTCRYHIYIQFNFSLFWDDMAVVMRYSLV